MLTLIIGTLASLALLIFLLGRSERALETKDWRYIVIFFGGAHVSAILGVAVALISNGPSWYFILSFSPLLGWTIFFTSKGAIQVANDRVQREV